MQAYNSGVVLAHSAANPLINNQPVFIFGLPIQPLIPFVYRSGQVINVLVSCRPHRRPHRLSYGSLSDVKDNDRLADDLRINLGDIRINRSKQNVQFLSQAKLKRLQRMHAHGRDQLQFVSVQSRTLASPNQYNAYRRLRGGGERIRCVYYGNGATGNPRLLLWTRCRPQAAATRPAILQLTMVKSLTPRKDKYCTEITVSLWASSQGAFCPCPLRLGSLNLTACWPGREGSGNTVGRDCYEHRPLGL
jgi:hypothetical protein